jgi:Zn-finger nucleic acid-binding protein
MKCPICNDVTLVMAERQGIEIDYCPRCRGVWLDRGELDKIIERSIPESAPPRAAQQVSSRDIPEHKKPNDEGHYRRRKRRGFLDDLFDFD